MHYSFLDAVSYLDRLQKFGIKLGLEQTRKLFDAVGAPDRKLRFIHLAGSNGKGSCGAMLLAALRQVGFSVGYFSSPHLISPRERMRIDGRAISERDFAALVVRLQPIADRMAEAGSCPTYFEFTTAMAALFFAEQKVDFVVWETGMGGRFDATNIVTPLCSIITGIALDHQQYLGDTIVAIAHEKAGIIKPGIPVFTGVMPDDAFSVIGDRARSLGASVTLPAPDVLNNLELRVKPTPSQSFIFADYAVRLVLMGKMQRNNFRIIFPVLQFLAERFDFSLQTALTGLATVRWPGRCQFLPDGTVIDGAHNPDGLTALTETLAELFVNPKLPVIFGNFSDKATLENLKILEPLASEFIFTPIRYSNRPSYSGEQLCSMLETFSSCPAIAVPNAAAALTMNVVRPRLITGSLFLAGEVLQILCNESEILDI